MSLSDLPLSESERRRLKELGLSLEWRESENESRLVLSDLSESKQLPLEVDFLNSTLLHRLKHGLGKGQPLPKALGIKTKDGPSVIDATAGLGTDAFIMAAYGCRVLGLERSPVVVALLQDGLRRLNEFVGRGPDEAEGVEISPELFRQLSEIAMNLKFEMNNSIARIEALTSEELPEVIYLDPMYPEEGRSKSALPKKGMQVFRKLIGGDDDAKLLLEVSLLKAKQRVVVKRPLHAPVLNQKPTHTFQGKTARYDMYLTN